MTNCRTVQPELTAWIDAELSPPEAERVGHHVAQCAACTAEAEGLRTTIALQRRLLVQLAEAGDTDAAALHVRLRQTVAAQSERAHWDWAWIFRPVVLAPAFAMLAVFGLLTIAGGPTDVLAPLGVTPPPPAVKQEPGLFKDYTLIEHLDALENFDTVEAEPLDDDDAQTG